MLKTLRQHFLTGLLSLTPIAITVWIVYEFYGLIDRTMRPLLQRIPGLTDSYPDFVLTSIAFLCTLLLIVLVGLLARNLVGMAFFNLVERLLQRIPVVKSVFSATKQIAGVFLSDQRSAFQKVVCFEYPRPGSYSLGFVTHDAPEHQLLNVFLPTTPNPTSGYLLMIPRDQVAVLPLSVEEGIQLIISGGSVMTGGQAAMLREEVASLLPATDRPAAAPSAEEKP